MSTITKAGRYELHEELGRGAMGVVHRAHDPVIGRDVAVKTMHLSEEGTGMSREELISRFHTEARAAGLLTHPNIVVVYDAGEEQGLFYITMELVEGRSLQSMLDARQLFPLARIMKLMEQICSALDFAHQRNVVHRDIKPANLMLTAEDNVKVTDFGTAKILQFGTAQTAHVMGTPSYMSPEQVKGKPVDGRSDIFSLGVILYELMTGEKPFPGQNITTVIYKIINEDPIPPRSLDSSIHPGLSDVITQALAKDPAARFQTCHEFLDALIHYRESLSPDATLRSATIKSQAAAGGTRATPQPQKSPAEPLIPRTPQAETPIRLISAATAEEERSARNRGSFLLSVILLGIIGFAGYRVWPPMVDLWQRAHQPSEIPAKPASVAPATPAAPTGATAANPDAAAEQKSDATADPAPHAAQPVAKTVPAAPESPALQQAPAQLQKIVAQSSAKPTGTATGTVASSAVKPTAANSLKSTLGAELAAVSLADKVKMQVTGNTLALSGRLTSSEHRQLLILLHTVPAGVRVIDDIEYTEETGVTQ